MTGLRNASSATVVVLAILLWALGARGEDNSASRLVPTETHGNATKTVAADSTARFSAQALSSDTVPLATPSVNVAQVLFEILTIYYDSNLDTGSTPATSAYQVTAGGSSVSVTGVSVGFRSVSLTLARDVVTGQTVTLSYTVPSANPVKDTAGDPAGPITNRTVTNLTPELGYLRIINTTLDEDAGATGVAVATPDPRSRPITVDYTSRAGTATTSSDYKITNGTLTIPAGQPRALIPVTIVDDGIDEDNETFFITISNPTRAILLGGATSLTGTVTIKDDDTRDIGIWVPNVTYPVVAEGSDTTYYIHLRSEPTGDVTVTPSRASGDADVTVSGPLTFTSTNYRDFQPVTVSAAHDDDEENDTAVISHAVAGADYGANNVTARDLTVTVTDDDKPPPALVLNVGTITDDNTVNSFEKAAGFSIRGDTGSHGGASVTVSVGGTELTATSADADPATWSVGVPAGASYITGTSVAVQVNASKAGFTSPSTVTRTVTVDLIAPEAPTYTAPSSLKVGVPIAAMNPSGGTDVNKYQSTGGFPSGLGIDVTTGVISGTPDTANADTDPVTVVVTDTAGNGDTVDITFPAVAKGDQTLSGFQYGASSVRLGATAPTVTAPTGVRTTLSYSATPSSVCTVNSSTGALSIVGVGSCQITATAAGTSNYTRATATFTVTVQAAPTLQLIVGAIAGDNTVNIAEKAAGFSISGNTGAEAGVSVSVQIGSTTLAATSAADSGTARWSVSVPAGASYLTGTSVTVSVSASKTGFTSPSAVRRTLRIDLTAPTAPTYTAPGSLKVGEAITTMSPSGGSGIDKYSATGLPSGLSINATTGAIGGSPDSADANTASATVTVSDTAGNTATVAIAFPAVAKGDQTLSGFRYSASSVTFGSAAPSVTAPRGARGSVSYSATPSSVCTVNASTGALTIVGAGSCRITATAAGTDDYNEATAAYTVTVQATGTLALNVHAIAGDNTVNIAEKAAGFSISGDTGTETGVGVSVKIGSTNLTATSSNADPATWSVSVPAGASYISGTSVAVEVNASKTGFTSPSAVQRTLAVDLTAPTAPDYSAPGGLKVGTPITAMSPSSGSGIDKYSATGLPSGLSIDSTTGVISGTPDRASASPASATVTVSDTAANTATVTIAFPAVAKGDQTLSGFRYSASSMTFGSAVPTVTPPTGVRTTLSYSATPSSVCTVNSTTGALTIVGVGSCEITTTAAGSDDYNAATATHTVTVQATGALVLNVGVIAGDNTVNIAEKALGFAISGNTGSVGGASVMVSVGSAELTTTSSSSDPATWSVSVPAGASYITGTSVSVQVNASKSNYTAPSAVRRTLRVDLSAPASPSYSAPGSLKVGVPISPMNPADGADIDQYSAAGLPSGLSINAATGVISGRPISADAHTAGATVTVADTAGNTATVDIAFPAVAKGNQTLSGFRYSTASVNLGASAPVVTAPSGVRTTLGYSATPSSVCTVNSTTGALSIVGAGSCVIAATAAGTDDYNEATATFTVTVTRIVITDPEREETIEDEDTTLTGVELSLRPASVNEDRTFIGMVVTGTLNGLPRDSPTTVTISVGSNDDAATAGTDYAVVDARSLTIAAGRTSGTAILVLRILDDLVDEPDEAVSITGTTEAEGLEVIGTTVIIVDDDERGVTVSRSDLTFSEGESATYSVVLDTEPTDAVTLTPKVSGSPDLAFEPARVTFTSADWNTAQTMTVTATEDEDAYHDSSIVTHAAAGADYNAHVGGSITVTISDNDPESRGERPAQVTGLSTIGTETHVDLSWSPVEDDTLVGYRIEASYDGGANWTEVATTTESTGGNGISTTFRHEVGLNFAETRHYRASAVNESVAGLPSILVPATSTSMAGGLTATVRSPAVDLCWIVDGVDPGDLNNFAVAWTPVHGYGALSSASGDLTRLSWQSIRNGSAEVDCEGGIAFRLTSISENQRYAFRMRASHDGVWLVSNGVQAILADESKPLRTVVAAGASGLSGDTPAPELLCRNYDDPATRDDEAGAFLLSIGFTTADAQYLRYEPVAGFDPASDLTLVNARAEVLDQPYDTLLGYRVRITPDVWGEPVGISVPADAVAHAETGVGNQASGEFTVETLDADDCGVASEEPVRRAQVTAAGIEEDGGRDGVWSTGEPIRVTLRFDELVGVDTTDGVPRVTLVLGEEGRETGATEQSSDGGTVEVTAQFSHVAHDSTLVFDYLVTTDESPVRDIELLADSLALNGAMIDSFSGPAVDLAHPGTSVIDGQVVQSGLTAHWSSVPDAHEGGNTSFVLHLTFSEEVDLIEVIGEQALIDHAFTVTGGRIEAVAPARDRRGEYRADEWTLRVAPDFDEPVTIALVPELACGEPGAICTIDDRALAEAPSVTAHRTAQAISVADAEVTEGPGAELVFELTLARAGNEPVTVDYETVDGTATAGEDYVAASGTVSLAAGQTAADVRVSVLDDDHDEGAETLRLVLTNAVNADIDDGEAIGTIGNRDSIPAAWLARFGRTASDHVVQAVARRGERRSTESHLTLGGLRLDRLFAGDAAVPETLDAAASMPVNRDLFAPGPAQAPELRAAGGWGHEYAAGGLAGFGDARSWSSSGRSSLGERLMDSSFQYSYGNAEASSSGSLTAWGETATTRFGGSDGALSLDGEVSTALVGLDKQYGRWLVGTTLAYSEGEGGYRRSGARGGAIDSTLTSVNPYAHFELSETVSLWGVFGYGTGTLRVAPQHTASVLDADLSNRMLAFGGRGRLSAWSSSSGGVEIALRSDLLLTHTDSGAVPGLAAAQGATSRVRLLLEGSGSLPVRRGTLRPRVEAGLRYDGGDAETGVGLEIGGGLAYTSGRLSVEVDARGLVAHDDADFEERGFSGSLAYRAANDGRGLSMTLGSAWGATQSGVQSMWSQQGPRGLEGSSPMDAAQRFEGQFGYGLESRDGRRLLTPFFGLAAARGGEQMVRLGIKVGSGANARMGLELGRRAIVRGEVDYAVELEASLRW